MHKTLFLVFLIFLGLNAKAQNPEKLNAAQIYNEIQKLNFLGSALYIAAHPDDENTRLISYLSNEIHARTGYLSVTRGDGGQNLIGPELGAYLGLIRTQELLQARKIDGGEQFFTRANDFGYSKTPEETLKKWNREEVLSDVVRTIRKFRPDVIINRFDHRTPGSTHGHHTSSAILSMEAFDLAGDTNAYPGQLKQYEAFHPKRLFFNTSYWFYGSREAFEEADKSNLLELNSGVYFPLLGLSNPEIAALSRSQHQSQGFGSTGTRGDAAEYLELLKGDMPLSGDIFEGIDTSWNRLEGGAEIREILTKVERDFDFKDPSASLPGLVEAYKLIQQLEDPHWRELKTNQIKRIIVACSGLFLEAVANEISATPGEEIQVNLEAINRSEYPVSLKQVALYPNDSGISLNESLENNKLWNQSIGLKIPEQAAYTSPYWLQNKPENGLYKVENPDLIGLPETPQQTRAVFNLEILGEPFEIERPVIYKYTDAVFGETYRPFTIIPEISLSFDEEVLIFPNTDAKKVMVNLNAGKANVSGELSLKVKDNWKVSPASIPFNLAQKGSSTRLQFEIQPPKQQDQTEITPRARIGEKTYSEKLVQIDYKHIPLQNLVLPAAIKASRVEIQKKGENIGYIEGAGDAVPQGLEAIGYKISKINPAAISEVNLRRFDAVVLGIRAYNTIEELRYRQNALFNYVKNGGTLIVQYNTSQALLTNNLAPYELKLSRDRVTEENAAVSFLAPDHQALNSPNKIEKADFENWVQERGLYFPSQWSEDFTALLSMHDSGEEPKTGSLLVAAYGKGYFVYTGLSFFRQLPAGVPGAFRLFANLLSLGK